jgi:hypothetical protein
MSDRTRGISIKNHHSIDDTTGTSSISSQSLSSSRRSIRRFRRSTSRGSGGAGSDNNAVRKRYLYRLGISDSVFGSDVRSDHDSITTCSRDSLEDVHTSSSLQASLMGSVHHPPMSQSPASSRSTGVLKEKTKDKVLLKKSVEYTTDLKFDKSDPTDVEKTHQADELSNAWSHLLALGEADALDTQEPEPLDGAFDLFSLPSDSSIASFNRTHTPKASSTDSLTEVSSFNSNTLASSFSFQSMHREISEIHQANSMSLSDHSTLSRRKVSFDSTVKATTIPARHSYSQRVRTKLWSSSEDIVSNAIRNEFEYNFDGHNWRSIREEKDFISIAPSSDEMIHPAHFYGCWPHSSRSMPSLQTVESPPSPEKRGSSDDDDDDDDGSGLHFCGVFGMELNTE